MKLFAAFALTLTVGVLLAFVASAAAQQAYPNKPIRIIVPYPSGGGGTIAARLIGPKLTESWGQQVPAFTQPGWGQVRYSTYSRDQRYART